MKFSRKKVNRKAHAQVELRFESQHLTAFAGLVVLQTLFDSLGLPEFLRSVFRRRQANKVYSLHKLFLQLVIHLLLGFRSLRDVKCYENDPMVKRLLGMSQIASASTISRMLGGATDAEVVGARRIMSDMVCERLRIMAMPRITLDFDGSVQVTKGHAEGTAVGFNKQKKGARSYYPLFCTVAQTGQVLDFLHRPGNVHDSNGAREFILQCVELVRRNCPYAVLEVRMDSAFFSDEIVGALADQSVEFTISVPFERFPALKQIVEERRKWLRCGDGTWSFEIEWKPKSWLESQRFVVIRKEVGTQRKGPMQLDLFEPQERSFEYKVIVTNKNTTTRSVTRYHEGRGAQESIFGEMKSDVAMGHIPVRRRNGNQMYLLAGLIGHNLIRELQMRESPPQRGTVCRRATLWVFERISTLRQEVFARAGRFTRPNGRLTLTINAVAKLRVKLLKLREAAAEKIAA